MDAYPYKIPQEMYREQRARLGATLGRDFNQRKDVCVLLQGCTEIPRGHYSDVNFSFRQDSYFQYLFNLEKPDCYGAVLADGTGIIFIPQLPASYSVWMGILPTFESIKKETGIDEVYYVKDIADVLCRKKCVSTICVLEGVNSDSGYPVKTASFSGEEGFTINKDWLYDKLSYQRCIKTEKEKDLLTWINSISSAAHVHVMQNCKPGISQHHLESNFLHYIYYNGGMREVSYACICATGASGAILHYPYNDKPVEDGSMCLLDMGGEYHCYASDITCSYPCNGRFTPEQKFIYDTVLEAQIQIFKKMRPGVRWLDMHKLALSQMAKALIKNEFIVGLSVEQVMEKQLMKIFQPHGLGHLIGLEVHDVGGYPKGGTPRCQDADSKALRTCCTLEEGMFITVEPGLYFNKVLLTQAFEDPELKPYLNESKIRRFWEFGGVRIEDDVIVTRVGIVNLTCCPRTTEEIEETMKGKIFKKEPQFFNNLK